MPGHLRRHLTLGKIFLALAALYLLIGLTWPGACHYSADGDAKELQVLSLRWDHGLRIDFVSPAADRIDPEHRAMAVGWTYFGVVDGQVRFAWPMPFALLSRPFYDLFGERGLFVVPALCGAACALLAGKIAERLRPGTGPLGAILTGLATPVFFYSTLFWEHTPALALGLLGTFLILRETKASHFCAGAALAAAAGAFRSDFYVFAAAIVGGAFFAWPGRRRFTGTLVVVLGAIAGSLPWFLLNYAVTRHVLPLNAIHNSAPPSLAYLATAKLGTIPHYLVGMTAPVAWRWRITVTAAVVVVVVRATWRRAPLIAVAALGLWTVSVLLFVRAIFDAHAYAVHGWLVVAPIAVFVLTTPSERSGDGLASRIVTFATVLHLVADFVLIIACYPNGFTDDGNLEWGPRYYIGIFPLLAVLAAERIPVLARDRRVAIGVAAVAAAGTMVEIAGLGHARHLNLVTTRVRAMTTAPDDVPLISDLWSVPALRHQAMFTRPTFTVRLEDKPLFPPLVERLWQSGYRRIQVVSFIPWAAHPFARMELPDGLELSIVRPEETDLVKATTLEIRQRPMGKTP